MLENKTPFFFPILHSPISLQKKKKNFALIVVFVAIVISNWPILGEVETSVYLLNRWRNEHGLLKKDTTHFVISF